METLLDCEKCKANSHAISHIKSSISPNVSMPVSSQAQLRLMEMSLLVYYMYHSFGEFSFDNGAEWNVKGAPKLIKNLPEGNMNICIKFQDNRLDSCWSFIKNHSCQPCWFQRKRQWFIKEHEYSQVHIGIFIGTPHTLYMWTNIICTVICTLAFILKYISLKNTYM